MNLRCRSYEFPPDLPTTSIVIVFHNEGNSTLLRTLTSIVSRSPNEYIQEIIMVDDASVDRGRFSFILVINYSFALVFCFFFEEYLKESLEEFVKQLPVPVHILRNTNRLGLMKSRLKGKQKYQNRSDLNFVDLIYRCRNS